MDPLTDGTQTPAPDASIRLRAATLWQLAATYIPYLITAGVLLLLLIRGEKFWMTNDDIRMSMTVGGYGITAAPSPDLVLESSVVWGWILQHLPDVAGIRAYTLTDYLLFLASGLALLYALRRLKVPPLFAAAALLSMYSVVILLPQFTLLAGYLSVAGFALVLASDRHNLRRSMAAAAFFLVLAGLVRPDELGLVFLVVSPFLLQAWFTQDRTWRLHWLGAAVGCGLVLAVAFFFNLHYSSGGPWQDYADMQDIGGEVIAYNLGTYLIQHPDKLAAAHVSVNDVNIMRSWFFLDPKFFNSANFTALVDSVTLVDRAGFNGSFIKPLLKMSRDPAFETLMALFVLFSALNWRRCIAEVASFAVLLALMVGISLYGRPGELRIWLPAAAAMVALSLLRLGPRHGKLVLLLGIVAMLGALHECETLYKHNARVAAAGRQARTVDCALVPKDRVVVVWTDAAQYRWKDIYRPFTRDDDPCDPKLYAIASYQLAPPSLAQLYAATGGRNLVEALLAGQQLYILTSKDRLKMLDTYLQEHYQAHLEWQQVAKNAFYQAYTIQAAHWP
ncbi:MAG TPA: hypothetical protein VGH91_06800 [Gammaproteobacteria bacterium]|jgi:hypothetical protein